MKTGVPNCLIAPANRLLWDKGWELISVCINLLLSLCSSDTQDSSVSNIVATLMFQCYFFYFCSV